MLTMSAVTSTWMLVGLRRSGGLGGSSRRHPGGSLAAQIAPLGAAADGARRAAADDSPSSAADWIRRAVAEIVRDCGIVLGRTAIYLAFNVLFVITLAFASRSAAGGTTVLSYAYLFASYLVAGTGMALGMSSIPDMTREARAQRRAVVAATVPRGFRYAMLIAAPALAGLIASGAPLIHAVLPAQPVHGGGLTRCEPSPRC